MSKNEFPNVGSGINDPAAKAYALSDNKSDTVDLPFTTRAIHANVGMTVTVLFANDSASVVIELLAGIVYPYAIKRVYSAGTDAGVLNGMY